MGKESKRLYEHEVFPSYIYSASSHHNMVLELLKKAQDLELKIISSKNVQISYQRLKKASEIYQLLVQLVYFGDYHRFFSVKELEEVYKGIRRTTSYEYEPLCFIRE